MIEFHQGDLSELISVRPNIADPEVKINADWSCKIKVVDFDGNIVVAEREVTEKTIDELYFVASLTPEETLNLPVSGQYARFNWIIQLDNVQLSPNYSREMHFPIIAHKQGVL